MRALSKRVAWLEAKSGPMFHGPVVLVISNPGETPKDAVARHEAEHGPRLPGQPAFIWKPYQKRPTPCD